MEKEQRLGQAGQEQAAPIEKKYPTIHGFHGKTYFINLVLDRKDPLYGINERALSDEEFFAPERVRTIRYKFSLGIRNNENAAVTWLPVTIQGKAAEKFLEILPELTVGDTLAIRGMYQDRVRNGKTQQEFWAFSIKPPERLQSPKPEKPQS